jgi:hypothetical protein
MAGLGLAEFATDGSGGLIWIRTDDLVRVAQQLDLSSLMPRAAQYAMTGSLLQIIDDMGAVEHWPDQDPEGFEARLLILAGMGFARMAPSPSGTVIWAPTPALINFYQMGRGLPGLLGRRQQELLMDDVLSDRISIVVMMSRLVGNELPGPATEIIALISMEVSGGVRAEIGEGGKFLWRLSDDEGAS